MVGGSNSFVSVLFNAIAQQILAVINQACQVALSLANQVTQYAQRELQSLTCIPIPKLGLGLGAISLGLLCHRHVTVYRYWAHPIWAHINWSTGRQFLRNRHPADCRAVVVRFFHRKRNATEPS